MASIFHIGRNIQSIWTFSRVYIAFETSPWIVSTLWAHSTGIARCRRDTHTKYTLLYVHDHSFSSELRLITNIYLYMTNIDLQSNIDVFSFTGHRCTIRTCIVGWATKSEYRNHRNQESTTFQSCHGNALAQRHATAIV